MKKNIVFYVTRQYMKQNKGRTLTTFAGIVFMVLLMTCVFVGKDTGIRYLQDVAALKDGKWHVSMYGITSKEYEEVLEVPSVRETAVSSAYGNTEFKASANVERPYLNVKAYEAPCFDWMNIKLSKGKLPENSQEIIVSESAVEDGADIAVGDQVEAAFFERSITGINPEVEETVFPFYGVTVKCEETKDVPEEFPYFGDNPDFRENQEFTGKKETYKVVGIMETPFYEQMGAAGYTALTLLEENQAAALEEFNLSIILDQKQDSDMSILRQVAGAHEMDVNDYLLAFTARSSDDTFNLVVRYMTVFFLFFIMAASVLLIYNVFDMSFQERSRYLGMLCSIGATGRQKRSSIYYEAFFLLIFALPVGILLGIGVIKLAMAAFRPLIGSVMSIKTTVDIYPAVIQISWENLAAVSAASIVTVLVSAWLPARKIGKIGPVECIRGNLWKKNRQYTMNVPFIHTFGAEGMLAKNMLLRRNKKARSVGSAAAVFMVVLIVTLFGSNAIHSVIDAKTDNITLDINTDRYDYMLYSQGAGFAALKEEIQKDAGVESTAQWREGMFAGDVPVEVYGKEYWDSLHSIYNLYYHRELTEEEFQENSPYGQGNYMPVSLLSVDDDTWTEMAEKTEADMEILTDTRRTSALVVNTGGMSTSTYRIEGMTPERYRFYHISRMTDLKEGDTIPLRIYSYEKQQEVETPVDIAGCVDAEQLEGYVSFGSDNHYIWLIVNEETGTRFAELMREEDEDNVWMAPMLFIRMNGEPTDLIEKLQQLSDKEDAAFAIAQTGIYTTIVDAVSDIVDVMLISFVALTSVICLLNLFNSIRGWILESRQEFAVLKSVGMTAGQIKKMLLYECAGIFLWALLLAGGFSGILIFIVRSGLTRIFGVLVLPMPWMVIAAAVVSAGGVLCGLALERFGKERQEDLFESIRRESV